MEGEEEGVKGGGPDEKLASDAEAAEVGGLEAGEEVEGSEGRRKRRQVSLC